MTGGSLTIGSEQILHSYPGGTEDDSFQNLLFEFSTAAAKDTSASDILKLFCQETRRYFQVSGAYVWQLLPPDQLVGAEADGWMAAEFRSAHMRTYETAIANEAIQRKQALFINNLDTSSYPMAAEFRVCSIMAVPLIISNEVLGAVVGVSLAGWQIEDHFVDALRRQFRQHILFPAAKLVRVQLRLDLGGGQGRGRRGVRL